MSARCPKCGLEHEPVDVMRWLWLFRDTKPKPPGKGVGILAMLAARMDAKTGCGWVTDPDLAELAGCGKAAVERATRWGRDRLLLHRVSKGYRITDERGQKSHWLLTDPATQHRISAAMGDGQRSAGGAMGDATQRSAGEAMATDPTLHSRTPNAPLATDPTLHQRRSIANPEKLNQEANPSARTHDRTGTSGQPGADRRQRRAGLSEPPGPDRISRSDDDPREMLRRFGATEDEADAGLRLIATLTADPAGYLRGKSGDPEAFMRWLRRQQDGLTQRMRQPPEHADTPPPADPDWEVPF